MKKVLLIIMGIVIVGLSYSQSPQGFKYQTVIRDNLGDVIENQNVSLRISVLSGTMSGPVVYQEEHTETTNDFGLVNLEIGTGNIVSGDFTTIGWGNSAYFIQVELDETGGTNYQLMGVSQLLSVPYAMYANNAGMVDSTIWKRNLNNIFYNDGNVGIGEITPTGKLVVKSDTTAAQDDVIFSVLNADGDTVLAVYQEGVRIWVSDDTTSGTKATGNRGGFAVGGFTPAKGLTNEYLRVTPDSVRVYIEEGGGGTKAVGNRGGFAVGGFTPAKAFTSEFLRVTDDSSRVWTYGEGGFGIMDIETGSLNYFHLTPSNYFIGHQSGDSITTGMYNSFFGYQSGMSNDVANDNVFIGFHSGMLNKSGSQNVFAGKETGYSNISGSSNCFIGHQSGFSNIDGYSNIFIGQETGFNNTTGFYNVFLGTQTGIDNQDGFHNIFVGYRCGYQNTSGWGNTFYGGFSGHDNLTGYENVFIGGSSGVNNIDGIQNVYVGKDAGLSNNNGDNNVFIGYRAGYNEVQSNRLYIESSSATSSAALIYGEFDSNKLRVNYFLGVGRLPVGNELEVQGDASKTVAGLWGANSDRRIKTDIQEIDNAFEKIMKIRPVKFKYTEEWKSRNPSIQDRYYYNFIAQEFEQVFPCAVKGSGEFLENDPKEILQVDPYNAYVVAIKAIQDLITENEQLKMRINDMQKSIDEIESVLNTSTKK